MDGYQQLTSPLFQLHRDAGAVFVEIAGRQMPIHYGSAAQEHHQVRQHAGMFDLTHQGIIDVCGEGCQAFLSYLLSNDIGKLTCPGDTFRSCLLNEQAGIIDDVLVIYRQPNAYRLICNATTHAEVYQWMNTIAAQYALTEVTLRTDLANIAVQGPNAIIKSQSALTSAQRDAVATLAEQASIEVESWTIIRTGQTGEMGYHILLPLSHCATLWSTLLRAGVIPCGIAARDSLRLEAGFNRYGADMDASTKPFEVNLMRQVCLTADTRTFIGRDVYEKTLSAARFHQVGLVLPGKGRFHNQQAIYHANQRVGQVCSTAFSPSLGHSIALARVFTSIRASDACQVDIAGGLLDVCLVQGPFIQHGKPTFHW